MQTLDCDRSYSRHVKKVVGFITSPIIEVMTAGFASIAGGVMAVPLEVSCDVGSRWDVGF